MRVSRILVLLGVLSATPATAGPILSVTGAGGNQSGTVLSINGDALAASFQLSSAFTNVTIGIPLTCLQCNAQFFLMQNAIGPSSVFAANVRAVSTVSTLSGGGFINSPTTLFSGMNLSAGTYFIVMSLFPNTISGAVWTATQLPVVTAIPGASALPSQISVGYNFTTAPLSVFAPFNASLQFSVAGDPVHVPVPEPATAVLLLVGLVVLRRFHR